MLKESRGSHIRRLVTGCIVTILCTTTKHGIVFVASSSSSSSPDTVDSRGDVKELKICTVSGGLDIARFYSSSLRNLFRGALEDVEFIREYFSEAAYNQGIAGGMHDLDEMSHTLNWENRNMTSADTTLSAGLGYVDDRSDRRIDRYVGTINEPFVGDKTSDMALIDSVSNIFPWIVDRKSDSSKWWQTHSNGRSDIRESRKLDSLYTAAFIGTRGEAWIYYPPFNPKDDPTVSFGSGDMVGVAYDSSEEEFVKPNLPANNPERKTYLTAPYPDTAKPGLSLITAQAPVYLTGTFRGIDYDDTYIASTGVDISMAAISPLLEELDGTLTEGSFAFVVDSATFDMILITQSTVEKIYPKRTGFEESRVSRSPIDGTIVSDRRNQTYLVSDTIFQSPLGLDNADWNSVATQVKDLEAGQRSWAELDITLTGDDGSDEPTSFYVMYENWPDVANWTLAVFVPIQEVENAINVTAEETLKLEVPQGKTAKKSCSITNNGLLDLTITLSKLPPWLRMLTHLDDKDSLPSGETITLEFETVAVGSEDEDGNEIPIPDYGTSLIAFTMADDAYPECFHEEVLTILVEMSTIYEEEPLYLGPVRFYGYVCSVVIMATAIGWSVWVYRNRENRVVRASQPFFLHMMCLGVILQGASIIPNSIDDSGASVRGCSAACMAVPWLLALGFSITFSALFSKVWRINQIVTASKNYERKNVDISARHAMIPLLIMVSLNTIILSIWTGIDPIVWKREYIRVGVGDGSMSSATTGTPGIEYASTGFCNVGENTFSLTCTILLLVINFSALILAVVQLYQARELATEYSEGKYIAIAIGSMIQSFITGLPVLLLARHNTQAFYFVESTICFVICMSLLLLMFLPKYYIMYNEEQSKVAESGCCEDIKPEDGAAEWESEASMIHSSDHHHRTDLVVPTKSSTNHHAATVVSSNDHDLDLNTSNTEEYIMDIDDNNLWQQISLQPPCTNADSQIVCRISELTDSLFPISENEVTVDVESGIHEQQTPSGEYKEHQNSPFSVYSTNKVCSASSPDGCPQIPIRVSSTFEQQETTRPPPPPLPPPPRNKELEPPKLPTRSAFLASLDGKDSSSKSEDCPPRPPRRITSTMDGDPAYAELEWG